jgi:hypothetical protein
MEDHDLDKPRVNYFIGGGEPVEDRNSLGNVVWGVIGCMLIGLLSFLVFGH